MVKSLVDEKKLDFVKSAVFVNFPDSENLVDSLNKSDLVKSVDSENSFVGWKWSVGLNTSDLVKSFDFENFSEKVNSIEFVNFVDSEK